MPTPAPADDDPAATGPAALQLAGSSSGSVSLLARELLLSQRRVTMVGLSPNPSRPSYRVAVHLVAYGYDVIPVNPTADMILGRRSYASLADVPGRLGIVDVFRRAPEIPPIVEQAIRLRAAAVWLQLGLTSAVARAACAAASIPFVEDRCLKMEHCRWFGGLNWVGLNTGVLSSRREETHRAG